MPPYSALQQMEPIAGLAHPDRRFQHLPLKDRAQGQIRRVRIRPGQDLQSPIHLELQFTAVKAFKKADFIALSYTWGEESPEHQVYIEHNDERGWFSIRQNLFDFLTMRRDTLKSSPWFWIDQICIDQTNMAEKSHQVNQMSEIYIRAKNVEIWLGLAFKGSEGAIELIQSGAKLSDPFPKSQIERHLTALQKLADLPYWSRVWVVQELRLGLSRERDVVMRLGQQTFMWSEWETAFGAFWGDIGALNLPANLTKKSRNRIRPMVDSGLLHRGDWCEIHHLVADRECLNIRDKVFGVLSLVREELSFYPDYSITTQDLLFQILNKQAGIMLVDDFDLVSTALGWLHILDESHTEIDIALVRRQIILELRNRPVEGIREMLEFYESYWSVFKKRISLIGTGPDCLARMRLRWRFPDNGSLRWCSRWLRMGIHSRGLPSLTTERSYLHFRLLDYMVDCKEFWSRKRPKLYKGVQMVKSRLCPAGSYGESWASPQSDWPPADQAYRYPG